ncbi:MAG: Amino acid transport protein [Capsulimonas sp.]|jgi:hypothetical protein|nr:Amino acid transport protein [Capsulimonas sp.]
MDTNSLLVSMFFGTVGSGYALYGKKQGAMIPLVGGLAMIAVSTFITAPLLLTAISAALMAGIFFLGRMA